MSKDKVLFTLAHPVQAKRIRFIFEKTFDSYETPHPDYGGFAAAAELMFLRPDPLFDTVSDLFEDEAAKQLKAQYRDEYFLEDLEKQAEGHVVRDYLVTKIRLAKQLIIGEITPDDPVDFPIEVIQKTGPDSENYVMLFVPDRYTIDEQDTFLLQTKRLVNEMIKDWDIYKRYADRINIYALRIPSNEAGATAQEGRSFWVDSYFKTYLDSAGYEIGTNILPIGTDRLYELVEQLKKKLSG